MNTEKIKRWYYTHHMHINSLSIFETDEYSAASGYATKKDAIIAAINHINNELEALTSRMMSSSKSITDLVKEQNKLRNILNE